ncbi:hypothetical protein D047_0318A, partial [Vibrio parahaemolyticus VPTS-2010_2]|jgi:hypothetical protein
MIVI